LVIQNDITNRFAPTTIVAAITSRVNAPPYPNEVVVHLAGVGLENISTVRLDQIRTVDRQRLIRRLGKVNSETMRRINTAIRVSLGLIEL